MTGIEAIQKERDEQLTVHNRIVTDDKLNNTEYQLIDAAMTLIAPIPSGLEETYISANKDFPPVGWKKDAWVKLLRKPYEQRLVIAGALIAAELDRIS